MFQDEPVYVPHHHGFYYKEATAPKITPLLSEDEAARAPSGLPMSEVLASVQRKLSRMIPAKFQISLDDITEALSIREPSCHAL